MPSALQHSDAIMFVTMRHVIAFCSRGVIYLNSIFFVYDSKAKLVNILYNVKEYTKTVLELESCAQLTPCDNASRIEAFVFRGNSITNADRIFLSLFSRKLTSTKYHISFYPRVKSKPRHTWYHSKRYSPLNRDIFDGPILCPLIASTKGFLYFI